MDKSKDQDRRKGAMEQDQQNQGSNTSMHDAVLIRPEQRLIGETRAVGVAWGADPVVRCIDRVDEVRTGRVAGLAYRKEKITPPGSEVHESGESGPPTRRNNRSSDN